MKNGWRSGLCWLLLVALFVGVLSVTYASAQDVSDFTTLTPTSDPKIYVNNQGIAFTLNNTNKRATVVIGIENETGYNGSNNGVVTIPDVVTLTTGTTTTTYSVFTIDTEAFNYGGAQIKKVLIGKNVAMIFPAFNECINLEAITVDKANTSFEDEGGILYSFGKRTLHAFPAAKVVKNFVVPASVRGIEPFAFCRCRGIETLTIGNINDLQDMSIGQQAFAFAQGLKVVNLNGVIREIGGGAFRGASNLEEAYIRGSVKVIGARVFSECSSLRILEITKDVETMNEFPLEGCVSLESVTLPFLSILNTSQTNGKASSVTFCKLFGVVKNGKMTACNSNRDFSEYFPHLTEVRIHGGTLAGSAFKECINIKSIYLGEGVTEFGSDCFTDCISLERVMQISEEEQKSKNAAAYNEVWLGASIEKIGTQTSVSDIKIDGKTFKSAGSNVFDGCSKIERFVVSRENPAFTADYWGVLYDKAYTTLLCYPPASDAQFCCVKGTTLYVVKHAFVNCDNLVTINIPGRETKLVKEFFGFVTYKYTGDKFAGRNTTWANYKDGKLTYMCAKKDSVAESDIKHWGYLPWIFGVASENPEKFLVEKFSDRLVFETGSAPEFENLYLIVTYPGIVVLLDDSDFELSGINIDKAGQQTVTATYPEKTADGRTLSLSFNICYVEKQDGHVVWEYNLEGEAQGANGGIGAIYAASGQMLDADSVVFVQNNVGGSMVRRCAAYLQEVKGEYPKVFLTKNGLPFCEPLTESELTIQ